MSELVSLYSESSHFLSPLSVVRSLHWDDLSIPCSERVIDVKCDFYSVKSINNTYI